MNQEEGAVYVDEVRVTFPPRDTWHDLSLDALIDIRSKLYTKLDSSKPGAPYKAAIQQGIDYVQALINRKL